jgi:hypothetical protein
MDMMAAQEKLAQWVSKFLKTAFCKGGVFFRC